MTDTPDTRAPSRLQELFVGTLEYLQEQCGDDDDLLKRVKTLLAEDGRTFDPLEEGVELLIQEALDDKLRELQDGLHVRCPHCRNPIEMLNDQQWDDIDCPSCGSSFSLTSAEETILGERPGKHERIAHFTLNEQVGVGAFGTVWNATDTELDRTVALKIPRKGQLSADEAEKFLREARAAAQLKHPSIVSVHEVGRDDETIYIVSDFIKGLSLADWLTGQKPTFREAAELCVKVCDALQHAHSHGVIHRDLKPGNILLDQEFQPHLTDFGLAKRDAGEITMTLDGQILGTPAYMSPEQARGEGHTADARSDVYSVGVILFELLTGERPFRGNTRMLLHQLLNEDAPSPRKLDVTVPKDLETICLKCLEKDPDKRYASAKELQSDLQCFLDQKPIAARPIGRLERGWRWCKRNPAIASLLVIVLFLLLLLGIGGPIVAVEQSKLARKERDASTQAQEKTSELDKRNHELKRKTSDLADELRSSKAMRLAAQSQSVADELPVRSLLLATEAVQTTRRHDGTILPIARESLYEAVARVGGRPFMGHTDSILDVAFSSDGHWLATVSNDQTARLWDMTADDPVTSSKLLRGHESGVDSVAFSPDGRWLATASRDKTARLWNMMADDPAASSIVLQGHEDDVNSLAFSPDGRWLATASRDKTTRLWNLTDNDPADSPAVLMHNGQVYSVAYSPDGHWLATGSYDRTVRLWDLTDDDPADSPTVLNNDSSVFSLTFSPDARWLLAMAGVDNTVRLWDLTADAPTASPIVLQGHTGRLSSAAFSPDGHWVATGSYDRTVRLWDLTDDDPADSPTVLNNDSSVISLTFSPDGSLLAAGCRNKTARLWDLTDDDPAASSIVLQGHEGSVTSVAFSPDGHWLATASNDRDCTARLWDLTADQVAAPPTVLQGHEGKVDQVAYSPNGRWLVTTSYKGIRLWDTAADHPFQSSILLEGRYMQVYGAAFSPDGHWLATACWDNGKAQLWDLNSNNPSESPIELEGHEDKVMRAAFSPNGRWLVTACLDGKARLWDRTTGHLGEPSIVLDGHAAPLVGVTFSPAGRWMATHSGFDGEDRTIVLWDLAADDIRASQTPLPITKAGGSVFSADGHWLAHFMGETLELWDLTADDPSASPIVLQGHDGPVTSLAFSPDGRWMATATGNRQVPAQLWNLTAAGHPTLSAKLITHALRVTSLEFSPDGRWLATGSQDNSVQLWDMSADDPSTAFSILRGPSQVLSLTFRPDGRQLAIGYADNAVRFWDLDIDALIQRAKRAAGRELTPEERKQYLLD